MSRGKESVDGACAQRTLRHRLEGCRIVSIDATVPARRSQEEAMSTAIVYAKPAVLPVAGPDRTRQG